MDPTNDFQNPAYNVNNCVGGSTYGTPCPSAAVGSDAHCCYVYEHVKNCSPRHKMTFHSKREVSNGGG
jgi:uncharacterized Fe-S cluster-containing radical SAM superfamily protein